MAFHPYLNFPGTCREAFTRYHEIFGGELVLLPMSDVPGGTEQPLPPELADRILHAALKVDGFVLMASDAQDDATFGPVQGMYVDFSTKDAAAAERVFGQLCEDGKVEMPFGATFFSPGFGICVDRFGTPWMVDVDASEAVVA